MPAQASTGFLTQTPRLFLQFSKGGLMRLKFNIGKVRVEALGWDFSARSSRRCESLGGFRSYPLTTPTPPRE